MKLSIVVPARNEEDNIVEVIRKIEDTLGFDHELVVVNDHSTDMTRKRVEELSRQYNCLALVDNTLPAGFANALRIGFKQGLGEYVIPVMGDLCDDLETITVMLAAMEQGYDVVCGSRYMKGGARLGGSKLKAFFSRWGGVSLRYLLGVPTHDICNAFKMYRREVLEAIESEAEGFEISMELPLKAYYLGFKITEVPTVWHERSRGVSNFKVFKLLPRYIRLYFWAIGKRLQRRGGVTPPV